ncbi:hypothetical protein H312_01365 [Anncaliia algerae PRA339]|uniref:Endonuclease/exonuclease/phosphatase domain-containing protein n=1 Tax=Anncaliia algerae PRA339 TaxID=1288291 RepID=A0A059F2J7_9MICR|nr:hypothetical protein H312_01365 [Anncaliia algerae PRA339]
MKHKTGGEISPLEKPIRNEPSLFRIGFLNIAGIRGKSNTIKDLLKGEKIDILGLAETWLEGGESLTLATIARKEVQTRHKEARNKGGMCITYDLNTKLTWKTIQVSDINITTIDIDLCVVMFVYIPPRRQKEYIDIINEILLKPNFAKRKLLILDDFNIHVGKGNTCDFKMYEEMFSTLGITRNSFINEDIPIFMSHLGFSSPDHIWSRGIKFKTYVSQEETSSDHILIVAELSEAEIKRPMEVIRKLYTIRPSPDSKKYCSDKINRFKLMAKDKVPGLSKVISGNVDAAMNNVHNVIQKLHMKAFEPSHVKNKHQQKNRNNLQFSKETLAKIELRKKLKKVFFRTRELVYLGELLKVQSEIKEEVKRLEKIDWERHISNFSENSFSKTARRLAKFSLELQNRTIKVQCI